jgi:hypothetical protein
MSTGSSAPRRTEGQASYNDDDHTPKHDTSFAKNRFGPKKEEQKKSLATLLPSSKSDSGGKKPKKNPSVGGYGSVEYKSDILIR